MSALIHSSAACRLKEWGLDLLDVVNESPFFDKQWAVLDVTFIGFFVAMHFV